MTDPNISRRTILRTGAWSVPIIAVAVAAPAYAASGVWQLTRVSAEIVPGFNNVPTLFTLGDLSRTDGQPITQSGSAFILANTGESSTWNFSGGTGLNPYPFSANVPDINNPTATTSFTVTIEGETLGPFPVTHSPSGLGMISADDATG